MPRKAERISVFGGNVKGLSKNQNRKGKSDPVESMRQAVSELEQIPKIRTVKLNNFNYVDRVANSRNQ